MVYFLPWRQCRAAAAFELADIVKPGESGVRIPPELDGKPPELILEPTEPVGDLPPPEVLQQEIIVHLKPALASFRDVAAGLQRV